MKFNTLFTVSLEVSSQAKWFIVNRNHGGFYRVLYTRENYIAMAEHIMQHKDDSNSLASLTY